MAAIRILVVDDHRLFREGVRALLRSETDLEIVGEAETAVDGLRVAVIERPDVVLLDVRMPGESGLSAVRALRRSVPDTAIVMLTMMDDEATIAAAIHDGAAGYVLKGAAPEELLRALRSAAAGELHFGASVAVAARGLVQGRSGAWAPPLPELTERERSTIDWLAAGLPVSEIARRLHLSEKSVRNVIASLPRRLGVGTRAEAVELAIAAGLGRG